jgi:3-methyladenine DNA glycosylase AlkD
MNQEEIINTFKNKANAEKALGMEKYMKNLFPFLGISSPERKLICKELLAKKNLPEKPEAINFSKILWNKKEREFQYVAIDLLDKYKKQLEVDDIVWIEKLIVTKSWWDTVDFLAIHLAGEYFKKHKNKIDLITNQWNNSDNIWLQRSSLLFQLKYKQNTNVFLLENYILNLKESNEFFIRKSIGWILREYSKTNPAWVIQFLQKNELSNLSVREASKYL